VRAQPRATPRVCAVWWLGGPSAWVGCVAANSKINALTEATYICMQSTWPQKQREATESTCELGTTRGCGHVAAMNGQHCTGLLSTHSRHAPHAAPLQHLDCCVRERAPFSCTNCGLICDARRVDHVTSTPQRAVQVTATVNRRARASKRIFLPGAPWRCPSATHTNSTRSERARFSLLGVNNYLTD
jgi:hypothetical protein